MGVDAGIDTVLSLVAPEALQPAVRSGLPIFIIDIVDYVAVFVSLENLVVRDGCDHASHKGIRGAKFTGCCALNELGLHIPREVGVMTFDERPFSQITSPPLTVVDIDVRDMGEQAGKLLADNIKKPNLQVQTYTTKPELIIRASTRRKK